MTRTLHYVKTRGSPRLAAVWLDRGQAKRLDAPRPLFVRHGVALRLQDGEAEMTVISLPFPISVNAMFSDGKTRRHKSQRYADWLLEAGYALNRQKPLPVKGKVSLLYELQEGHDNRLRDLPNYEKGVTDLLVTHGIIEADHCKILRHFEMVWNDQITGVRVSIKPEPTESANDGAGRQPA